MVCINSFTLSASLLLSKDTLRQAFESGFIDYAQALIDGLNIRKELSHDYSGEKFEESEAILRSDIFPALYKLYHFFLGQLNEQTDH